MWEIFHVAVNNVRQDTSTCTEIRYSKFNCTAAPLPVPCQGSPKDGAEGEDHKVFLEGACSQAGKVSQWYSQFLLWVSAGSSISTLMYNTSHTPYPQTPCSALHSVPIKYMLQSSTLLSITVLHKCSGIWKTKTHSSSPNSPVSPCSFHFHRENSHQAQETWQTQATDTTGGDKGPQHCDSCSADPSWWPGLLSKPQNDPALPQHSYLHSWLLTHHPNNPRHQAEKND